MKIYVNRVPLEGVKERAVYDPAGMDMDAADIHVVEPFEVEAFITTVERELLIKAEIRAPLRCRCARCLEEFAAVVTPSAVFSYPVQPSDVVDITDDVRQEIILAYPMIPVCRPDCRGLCAVCGQNLNLAACPHQTGSPAGG